MVLEIRQRVTPACMCRSSWNFHTIFRHLLYTDQVVPTFPSSKIFLG